MDFLSSLFRPASCAVDHGHHAIHVNVWEIKIYFGIDSLIGDYCVYVEEHLDTNPRALRNSETQNAHQQIANVLDQQQPLDPLVDRVDLA